LGALVKPSNVHDSLVFASLFEEVKTKVAKPIAVDAGYKTNRYRKYVSNPKICSTCTFLSKCTQSQNHIKILTITFGRIIWMRLNTLDIRKKTKNFMTNEKTIERVFADLKEKHSCVGQHFTVSEKFQYRRCCFCCHEFEKISNLEVADLWSVASFNNIHKKTTFDV
jgi:hypothetical protein